MKLHPILAIGLLCVGSSGCASNHQKYDWGTYDPSLYGYYKDPTKVGELDASLAAIVKDSEVNRTLVPPGVYAEYGYLQLQQGKSAQAIVLFKREETQWPESKVFMERMIKVAAIPASASPSKEGSP
jgi:hypothetical protein